MPFAIPKGGSGGSYGRQQQGNLQQFLEGTVQYHGVVVQCATSSDVQGCYVLKTVCPDPDATPKPQTLDPSL